MLKAMGKLEEAEASYLRAIALEPDHALAHFNLGRALYIKGDKDSIMGLPIKEIKEYINNYKL